MRRIFTAALSLIALGSAAAAADLPPAPQLPPLEAQPTWTGFYAGLNVGGAFGSSRNAFTIAGFGLPTFSTPLAGRRRGRRGRLQLADGPLGPRARGELRGERLARQPHGALSSVSLRGIRRRAMRRASPGSERCDRESVMRSGTGSFTPRAAARLARSTRTRPRRSAHSSPLTIAARREAAGRWAAELKSNSWPAGARKSNIFMLISGSRTTTLSLEPADLERVAFHRQCDHRRRELPLLTQSRRHKARLLTPMEACRGRRHRPTLRGPRRAAP